MKIETVSYKGWNECIQISNNQIKLIVTTQVGPRIIFFGYQDGDNLFYENPAQLGTTGGEAWKMYGGHRFWQAPEVLETTYAPDNSPVKVEQDDATVRFIAPVDQSGIQKMIGISLENEINRVTVKHEISNHNSAPITLAPWALSVMHPGGKAVIPLNLGYEMQFLPTHALSLWGYTSMADPRWSWGERFIMLNQEPESSKPQKIGCLNRYGWAGYVIRGTLFVKYFGYKTGANYPDINCNFEAYTNNEMLELESLGPLTMLKPGQSVTHDEAWAVYSNISTPRNDAEVEKYILPVLEK